jgi:hypothetical protein
MEAGPAVVPKSEFARLLSITPGRVSQYIAEGKLHGPALVGEGRNAQIVVEVAREQLRKRLDHRRLGTATSSTRLGSSPAVPTPPSPPAPAPAPPISLTNGTFAGGDVVDEIQRERLKQIRAANRRQEEEELRRRGELAPAGEVSAVMRKLAARMLAVMDGGLAAMAAQGAATLQVPQRDLLHVLRTEWRKVREAAEAELRQQIAALPATVSFDPNRQGPTA